MRALRNVVSPVLVGATATTALLVRLLYPQPVGVADSYDGPRLMCHLNVDMHLVRGAERLREFVTFRYDHSHNAACSAGHLGGIEIPHIPYRSSQLLTLAAGRLLTKSLGMPGYRDLRVVGVVSCRLIGGALALWDWAVIWSSPVRLVICAALLVVLADPVFIDFAVAPFSEIAAVVGLLYVIPGILLLVQGGRRRYVGLLVVVLGGTFLITAKTQEAVVILPLAGLVCAFRFPLTKGPAFAQRFSTLLRDRLLPVGGVAVMAGCLFTVGAKQDHRDGMLTMGNFVTATVLPGSHHPTADLAALGGAPWLVGLSGKPVWCASPQEMATDDYQRFLSRLSHAKVALFLAARPSRIPRILNIAAEYFYDPRPGYTLCSYADGARSKMTSPKLGNYGREHGAPAGALDHRITPVSGTLPLLRGTGFLPLVALWLAPAAAAVATLRRRGRGEAVATLFLLCVALVQFGVSAFGDGIDTSKHLNLAVFATAVAWVTGGAALLLSWSPDWRRAVRGWPARNTDKPETQLEHA